MIIIMSDSHGDREIVEEIKNKYNGTASAIIHCGDSELPSSDPVWKGITVVEGNCDFDSGYPEVATIDAENKKIVVTHGHLYGVNFGLKQLELLAQDKKADIAFFGHIHRPVATIEDGILFLNPGSISQPRGDHHEKMYCKLELNNEGYHIQYLTRDHKPIKDLEFQLKYDR
ncbi:YfcE family phosphodiesterase [Floricoccus tropicus]|uniref:Phosphoesterase n=1 Tax=Floricoccus tropicus TaxID=1859473 RepID=A0A1E8GMK4_9LACT|nr:metallophosphoesterase [Floricoccus tropicus]OFI49407.1 YfcE family phosphodiesterase [Floricoccus tropicus]